MRKEQAYTLIASFIFLFGTVAVITYAETGHREGPTKVEPDTLNHTDQSEQTNNITISVNGSTAYDTCLSRTSDNENWTSSHYMHCEDTLKLCQNSESCLITYKANRSNNKYAHFRAEGDPVIVPWQVKLNQYVVPGFLTLGTNYPNTTHYDKNSVGWNIWKDGLEKRRQFTNRSNSIQIDSAAQIGIDTSTQYEHTWEFSQDSSSYFCKLQDANLTDNSGTFQCHSKKAAEQFLNKTK